MKTNDVEGFRRARSINQLFYETIPQFLLQLRILIWIRSHQEDSLSTYIDTETLTISLSTALLHGFIEVFLTYTESKAAKTSMKNYGIVCMNGRFDWLPYENILKEALHNEDGEYRPMMTLDYGNISYTLCN